MTALENKYWGLRDTERRHERWRNLRGRIIEKSIDKGVDPSKLLERLTYDYYSTILKETNKLAVSFLVEPEHLPGTMIDGPKQITVITIEFEL